MVEITRELCDTLSRLNITRDPALETARRDVEVLVSVEPDALRKNEDLRAETSRAADEILRRIGAFYTPDEDGE
jgi:hypothetical protein